MLHRVAQQLQEVFSTFFYGGVLVVRRVGKSPEQVLYGFLCGFFADMGVVRSLMCFTGIFRIGFYLRSGAGLAGVDSKL